MDLESSISATVGTRQRRHRPVLDLDQAESHSAVEIVGHGDRQSHGGGVIDVNRGIVVIGAHDESSDVGGAVAETTTTTTTTTTVTESFGVKTVYNAAQTHAVFLPGDYMYEKSAVKFKDVLGEFRPFILYVMKILELAKDEGENRIAREGEVRSALSQGAARGDGSNDAGMGDDSSDDSDDDISPFRRHCGDVSQRRRHGVQQQEEEEDNPSSSEGYQLLFGNVSTSGAMVPAVSGPSSTIDLDGAGGSGGGAVVQSVRRRRHRRTVGNLETLDRDADIVDQFVDIHLPKDIVARIEGGGFQEDFTTVTCTYQVDPATGERTVTRYRRVRPQWRRDYFENNNVEGDGNRVGNGGGDMEDGGVYDDVEHTRACADINRKIEIFVQSVYKRSASSSDSGGASMVRPSEPGYMIYIVTKGKPRSPSTSLDLSGQQTSLSSYDDIEASIASIVDSIRNIDDAARNVMVQRSHNLGALRHTLRPASGARRGGGAMSGDGDDDPNGVPPVSFESLPKEMRDYDINSHDDLVQNLMRYVTLVMIEFDHVLERINMGVGGDRSNNVAKWFNDIATVRQRTDSRIRALREMAAGMRAGDGRGGGGGLSLETLESQIGELERFGGTMRRLCDTIDVVKKILSPNVIYDPREHVGQLLSFEMASMLARAAGYDDSPCRRVKYHIEMSMARSNGRYVEIIMDDILPMSIESFSASGFLNMNMMNRSGTEARLLSAIDSQDTMMMDVMKRDFVHRLRMRRKYSEQMQMGDYRFLMAASDEDRDPLSDESVQKRHRHRMNVLFGAFEKRGVEDTDLFDGLGDVSRAQAFRDELNQRSGNKVQGVRRDSIRVTQMFNEDDFRHITTVIRKNYRRRDVYEREYIDGIIGPWKDEVMHDFKVIMMGDDMRVVSTMPTSIAAISKWREQELRDQHDQKLYLFRYMSKVHEASIAPSQTAPTAAVAAAEGDRRRTKRRRRNRGPRQNLKVMYFDERMDSVANFFVYMVTAAEHVVSLGDNLSDYIVCMLLTNDQFNGAFKLHMNLFFYGNAATSKTFVLQQKAKASIPGTVRTVSDSGSTRSTTTESFDNYLTQIMQEAPQSLTASRYSRNPNDVHLRTLMKARLTDMLESREVLVTSDTVRGGGGRSRAHKSGERRMKKIYLTEAHGCMAYASNDPITNDSALQSRFYVTTFGTPSRPIADLMQRDRTNDQIEPDSKLRYEEMMRHIQFLSAMYQMAVNTRTLQDVEEFVCSVVIDHVARYFDRRGVGVNKDDTRAGERFTIAARQICITRAILNNFCVPGARHYDKPFEFEQLRDIEREAVITIQDTVIALGLLFAQYHDKSQQELMEAVFVHLAHVKGSVGSFSTFLIDRVRRGYGSHNHRRDRRHEQHNRNFIGSDASTASAGITDSVGGGGGSSMASMSISRSLSLTDLGYGAHLFMMHRTYRRVNHTSGQSAAESHPVHFRIRRDAARNRYFIDPNYITLRVPVTGKRGGGSGSSGPALRNFAMGNDKFLYLAKIIEDHMSQRRGYDGGSSSGAAAKVFHTSQILDKLTRFRMAPQRLLRHVDANAFNTYYDTFEGRAIDAARDVLIRRYGDPDYLTIVPTNDDLRMIDAALDELDAVRRVFVDVPHEAGLLGPDDAVFSRSIDSPYMANNGRLLPALVVENVSEDDILMQNVVLGGDEAALGGHRDGGGDGTVQYAVADGDHHPRHHHHQQQHHSHSHHNGGGEPSIAQMINMVQPGSPGISGGDAASASGPHGGGTTGDGGRPTHGVAGHHRHHQQHHQHGGVARGPWGRRQYNQPRGPRGMDADARGSGSRDGAPQNVMCVHILVDIVRLDYVEVLMDAIKDLEYRGIRERQLLVPIIDQRATSKNDDSNSIFHTVHLEPRHSRECFEFTNNGYKTPQVRRIIDAIHDDDEPEYDSDDGDDSDEEEDNVDDDGSVAGDVGGGGSGGTADSSEAAGGHEDDDDEDDVVFRPYMSVADFLRDEYDERNNVTGGYTFQMYHKYLHRQRKVRIHMDLDDYARIMHLENVGVPYKDMQTYGDESVLRSYRRYYDRSSKLRDYLHRKLYQTDASTGTVRPSRYPDDYINTCDGVVTGRNLGRPDGGGGSHGRQEYTADVGSASSPSAVDGYGYSSSGYRGDYGGDEASDVDMSPYSEAASRSIENGVNAMDLSDGGGGSPVFSGGSGSYIDGSPQYDGLYDYGGGGGGAFSPIVSPNVATAAGPVGHVGGGGMGQRRRQQRMGGRSGSPSQQQRQQGQASGRLSPQRRKRGRSPGNYSGDSGRM